MKNMTTVCKTHLATQDGCELGLQWSQIKFCFKT